ncbi:tyrosine-type recombinase/integrase [Parvibaculum sp.]|uniref:tyrosine-type recombinase/integrase n=1 Tax=Parvibaculum sp. TaxID=2024848 RepID=UPI002CD74075|nr:tyrosine-type recombinase/integrase [Parvibaculum sp.]HUD51389.1 tyrosine-type recombinase/integrase [Parvibaculum sp.]
MALVIQLDATISLAMKYVMQKGKTFYFQRRIPPEVQQLYGGKRTYIKSLQTRDPFIAGRKARELGRSLELYWKSLRRGGDLETGLSAVEVRQTASALLHQHNLHPKDWQHREDNPRIDARIDAFLAEEVDPYRASDELTRRDETLEDVLPPEKLAALQMLRGEMIYRLSDARDLYIKHKIRGDKEASKKARRLVEAGFESLEHSIGKGDLPLTELRRAHVNKLAEELLEKGNKTATVKRRTNTLRAAIELAIREYEIDMRNPFDRVLIRGHGEDSKEREPFTEGELKEIGKACKERDDDVRWLVALVEDTGARMAEIVGLRIGDIHVEAEIPYIDIRPNDVRRLKTKSSERQVPLVGFALWAAKRIVAEAEEGCRWAFPRYVREDDHAATHASNTIAKWLRGTLKIDKTAHSFRHAMRDRLRNVGAPKDIQDAIGGWSSKDIGDNYGKGYALKLLAEWMKKVELAA